MADGDTGYLREAAFWKQSVLTLLLVTLALNVLSLTIPVAASQIFGHLIPAPYSPTLLILVASVVCLGAAEGLLRFARAAVLNRAGANFAGLITHRLLTHIITSDPPGGRLLASRSIEYLGAIQQLKEKYNGQIVVSMIELLFLPIILAAIFAISWMTGLFVLLCLAIFGLVTLLDARRMERLVDQSAAEGESRYDFLFTMLDAMHLIKALGIEDNILRRFEAGQSSMSRRNHQLGLVTGRLLNSASVASQSLTAATLALGAIAVGHGQTTMGGVSALVLLSGRVMAPLQQAIFLFVQMKDIGAAQQKIVALLRQEPVASPRHELSVTNEGRVSLNRAAFHASDGTCLFRDVNLTLQPGEIVAISGPSERANSALLQIIAGVHRPAEGTATLNGVAPTEYPQPLLNRCVGYVSSEGILFRGTIRDNITRFGEVSVEAAMEVAALLGIDAAINELPNGLDTQLMGSAADAIPPGLRQQLTILRALATRPKLILLDNADRALDREGYAKLSRFIGKVHGQATFILVSDDANLLGYADKRFLLSEGGLRPIEGFAMAERISYRDLRV
ncbi:ATP-binding cassette domain-containing protein [Teichococcus aestuarii]|uniref:ATP-binding cassette domain-containing protein n=1 Tax=Teichococcus aestuarii TaxID=568898 RepID=UPI0036191149